LTLNCLSHNFYSYLDVSVSMRRWLKNRCRVVTRFKRCVCARRDLSGDFGQVQVHGLRVASGHDEGCALSVLGADRGEDISRGGSFWLGVCDRRSGAGAVSAAGIEVY
jgi:hypothetical protein